MNRLGHLHVVVENWICKTDRVSDSRSVTARPQMNVTFEDRLEFEHYQLQRAGFVVGLQRQPSRL